MTEIIAERNPDICPMHPGIILEEAISSLGKNKAEIARLLGISRTYLYDIMSEKRPITPNVAVRIGKLFGNGAGIWLRMQTAYDIWQAEHEIDVSHIPTLRAAPSEKGAGHER